jgi:hypothetical protein
MQSDLTTEEMQKIVQHHVTALMEHFDSVQIFGSVVTDRGTEFIKLGGGNWFARQGMAHDFITCDRAQTEAREISRAIHPEE